MNAIVNYLEDVLNAYESAFDNASWNNAKLILPLLRVTNLGQSIVIKSNDAVCLYWHRNHAKMTILSEHLVYCSPLAQIIIPFDETFNSLFLLHFGQHPITITDRQEQFESARIGYV